MAGRNKNRDMNVIFFKNRSGLRKWFEKNHSKKTELLAGYYKVKTGKPTISWSESVDEALCFGWIDGIRKSIDEASYMIRFTPRKPGSTWSAVNIKKVEKLSKLGLMKPHGLEEFNKKKADSSAIYSYETGPATLDPGYEKKLKANKQAWEFFRSLAPSYRNASVKWVMSAKQEKTRNSRLDTLIKDSESGRKIKPLSYGVKK